MTHRRNKLGVAQAADLANLGRIWHYRRSVRMLASLRKFSGNEIAQERLKIIQFYEEHGEAETQKYFGASRKTVHVWKKKLEAARGQLAALGAHSTRPQRVRRMTTDRRIVAFIRELRHEHPRLGKEKIKPLLDQYCQGLGIRSLAVSTIGKVLKRNQLFFQIQHRPYHDPNWPTTHPTKKHPARSRVRYAPQPADCGHWELDTLVRQLERLQVYFYSAIDVRSKWALSIPYSHLNSHNTCDFFQKLQSFYPLPIQDVQTDNGQEFQGEFEALLLSQHIPHRWSYPRCPRINGCIERYQRTLNEEFIQIHDDSIRRPQEFLRHLADFLVFYHTERIHHALHNQTPLAFLLAEDQLSKMSVTYTRSCRLLQTRL